MNEILVFKIGGKLIDDKFLLNDFLKKFSMIKIPKILVHGGGQKATELSKKLNVKVKIINGRRITNKNSLKIATMVYAGELNKKIVSKLQKLNCNSIGLSGADGNSIISKKRENTKINYGFVGDISFVNTKFIINLNIIMESRLLDQYTYLHFAVGIIVYFWGLSFTSWFIIHSLYEYIEITIAVKIILKLPT